VTDALSLSVFTIEIDRKAAFNAESIRRPKQSWPTRMSKISSAYSVRAASLFAMTSRFSEYD